MSKNQINGNIKKQAKLVIKEVDSFCYLGSTITHDQHYKCDIVKQIATVSSTFACLNKNIWNLKSMSMMIKTRLYTILIVHMLLYGCETWILTKQLEQKLQT